MNVERIAQGRKEAAEKSYSYAGKGGNYSFNLLGLRNLEPGRYRVRCLWTEPTKNPDGMYLVSTSIMNVTEEGKKKAVRFMTPDVLPPGEGYEGIPEVLKHLDESGKFDKLKEYGDKTKALREAIVALAPWRRFWMPVFIWAYEQPASKPGEYSKFLANTQDGSPLKPLDKILEMNENIKLIEAFFELCRTYPDLDSAETGRDLYITVGKNRYSIEIDPRQSRLDPNLARFASDNYPDLPALARRFYYRPAGEIASMVQAQWWAKQLEGANVFFPDHVDTSLTDLKDLGGTEPPKRTAPPPPPRQEETSADYAARENFTYDEPASEIVEDDGQGLPFDASDEAPHSAPEDPPARPAVRRPPPPRRA